MPRCRAPARCARRTPSTSTRVAAWLRANATTPTGLEGTPEVRQFSGGASNLTYLLRYPGP